MIEDMKYYPEEAYLKLMFILTELSFDLMFTSTTEGNNNESSKSKSMDDITNSDTESYDKENEKEYIRNNFLEALSNIIKETAGEYSEPTEEPYIENNIENDEKFNLEQNYGEFDSRMNSENFESDRLYKVNDNMLKMILNKPIRFFLESIDDIHMHRVKDNITQTVEYTKEEFIDMYKEKFDNLIKFIVINLFPLLFFSIRNMKILKSMYQYSVPHLNIIDPNIFENVKNAQDLDEVIDVVDAEYSKRKEDILEELKLSMKRTDYIKKIMFKISKLNIEKFIKSTVNKVSKYIEDNFDLVYDKFKYLVEKYYNNSAYCIVEIISSISVYYVVKSILDFKEQKEEFVIYKDAFKDYKISLN